MQHVKNEDLHPAILELFLMAGTSKPEDLKFVKREKQERVILELSEITSGEITKIRIHPYFKEPYVISRKIERPTWKVTFGVERENNINRYFEVVLNHVRDEYHGMKELEQIARDLERIYNFPYKVGIYKENIRVH